MKKILVNTRRALAIDPCTKGFGFAVLEGPEQLVDFGLKVMKKGKDRNEECLQQIAGLLDLYKPDILVVEDCTALGIARCARVQQLLTEALKLSLERKVKSRTISRQAVRKAFALRGAYTKHQIAGEVAKQFPQLSYHLPSIRKPWTGEDSRMSIFTAATLAVTFYAPITTVP